MESWVAKVLVIVIMLVVSLAFGLVPVATVTRLKRNASVGPSRRLTQKIISYLNCFAGGVFLATTFLHLLPEVREGMLELLRDWDYTGKFPVTECVVTTGMFIIMLVEHCVMSVQHHQGDVSFPSSGENSFSETQPLWGEATNAAGHGSTASLGEAASRDKTSSAKLRSYGSTLSGSRDCASRDECGGQRSRRRVEEDSADKTGHHTGSAAGKCADRDHQLSPREKRDKGAAAAPSRVVLASPRDVVLEDGACVHVIRATHHEHHHVEASQLGGLRSFLLLLAMSLHTVFEGLALGLQPTSSAVWSLFLAVIIHKCVIAFSLGVQFAENARHVTRAVIFIVFFAVMSPLGAAVGTALTEGSSGGSPSVAIASTVLQGVSTGVFLYVTFFEVLGREVGSDHGLLKVLLIIFGYGVIVALQLLLPEPHD